MTKRFYASTDGQITVFRATTRTYHSASFGKGGDRISFTASNWTRETYPAIEITKSEYDALQALKVQRISATGGNPAYYTSPQDSWVRNTQLADAGLEDVAKPRRDPKAGG